MPADTFIRELVYAYPREAIEEAIRVTAPKEAAGYFRRMDAWVGYLRSVAHNVASQPTEQTQQWRRGWRHRMGG